MGKFLIGSAIGGIMALVAHRKAMKIIDKLHTTVPPAAPKAGK